MVQPSAALDMLCTEIAVIVHFSEDVNGPEDLPPTYSPGPPARELINADVRRRGKSRLRNTEYVLSNQEDERLFDPTHPRPWIWQPRRQRRNLGVTTWSPTSYRHPLSSSNSCA